MAVTVRLYVAEITRYPGGEQAQIVLRAALQGEGNKSWSKWTPAATFSLTVSNPAAVAQFEDWLARRVDVGGLLEEVPAS